MKDDDPINGLLHAQKFKEKIAQVLGLPDTKDFTFSPLKGGMSKKVYKVTEEKSGKEFLIKEIRFKEGDIWNKEQDDDAEKSNLTLGIEEALYELATIRTIARNKSQALYFPKNYGLFAYKHPAVIDDYTDAPPVEKGSLINIAGAKKLYSDGAGVSFFIVEEFIKGQFPDKQQLAKAVEIRNRGIKTHPGIWLTVDTDNNDIIITDDGQFKFIDAGDFKENELIPEKQRLIDRMRAAEFGRD